MKVLNADISLEALDYLKDNLKEESCIQNANQLFFNDFGIVDFFENEKELTKLKENITVDINHLSEPDRAEYGDFQTNKELAYNVAKTIKEKNKYPQVIIEPTSGKGNFIIASLSNFEDVETIIGVEIYKPYIWESKFKIIDFYLNKKRDKKPKIYLFHDNFFDFSFKEITKKFVNHEILIIGNPPWVTNSELGSLNSENLPQKRNFKNHSGIDAITGKGNFDIAEYITMHLIETFQNFNGTVALLVKKSVVKNIVYSQKQQGFRIGEMAQYAIDAKKEFNVSVEAALFYGSLYKTIGLDCKDLTFYNPQKSQSSFGWVDNNFVSNIQEYNKSAIFDGISPFEWRQGVKHDCSSVMELEKNKNHYTNKNGISYIELESDLVYGILKSSDLNSEIVIKTRKHTIITQQKIGQETNYIKYDYPKTYDYLMNNIKAFSNRKSNIYKNKPLFSIFGVGDYSFKPYKVAISGLYKTYQFSLVLPNKDKPLMLDDTCYFIGFEKIEFAVYSLILLNSPMTIELLKSITFIDAKRVFTKNVLMRIDLFKIASKTNKSYIIEELNKINMKLDTNLNLNLWSDYLNKIQPTKDKQLNLF